MQTDAKQVETGDGTDSFQDLQSFDTNQIVILVVDDEELLRHVVTAVLRKQGYCVLTANNGEAAMRISRQFRGTIHLLVSDVLMPIMDGRELRRRIIEDRPNIKILLMSAYAKVVSSDNAILRKPFSSGVLNEHIRRLLLTDR